MVTYMIELYGTIFRWPLDVSSSALAKYSDKSVFKKFLFVDTNWK